MSPARGIARIRTGITAFVGRTLRGPVDKPVRVSSFTEFEHVFGGLWQPSTLSYAIEQFFENGGRSALVVRVANGARPPTLGLPAGDGVLRLVGVNPGSREYLRASVDYDGIQEQETGCFNLVLQRLRAPGSELIQEQEIHPRVTTEPRSRRYVANVLETSALARVSGAVPILRPNRSVGTTAGAIVGYVNANIDGNDGRALTDYDVIGSATERAGLFSLLGEEFDLLCIPPLARDQDLGPSALAVAARFCRDHQALLLVDPPAEWDSAARALEAIPAWPFRSENAAMFFPRVQAFDRLRARQEMFGSSAAAAGMIARGDEQWPIWAASATEEMILRPGIKPAMPISERERQRLALAGINTLQSVRHAGRALFGQRTLAVGTPAAAAWTHLPARRLALFVMASIDRGTRWLRECAADRSAWSEARTQVEAFLEGLDRDGAFAGGGADESYFAICDERVNDPDAIAAGRVNVLFGFALERPSDFHTCMVTHSASGSRVRPVTVNRQATVPNRVGWEIETAILSKGALTGT